MATILILAQFSTSNFFGGLVAGAILGVAIILGRGAIIRKSASTDAQRIIADAKQKADDIIKSGEVEAKAEYLAKQEAFSKETAETRSELKELERRLTKREDNVDRKLDTLASKEKKLETDTRRVGEREAQVESKRKELDEVLSRQKAELSRISGLSRDEATKRLLASIEQDVEQDAARIVEKRLAEARETVEEKSREVVVTAIQRYAAEHTSASTVSTVEIPSDEMKGRVIGREGRNIRAFERATGVDVIVDDTPGVVLVTAFDPVRREVAKRSLSKLIQDGRIHPGRIEEVVNETSEEIQKEIMEKGKAAAVEVNVGGLHKRIIELLGRLSFRTSYGQNVLRHSIEVAFLCQCMADEIGLDGKLARRCGLLHDIGKAVDHEVEGGHPQIGHDICKRFNEPPEVLNAAQGHHGDVEATSLYTPLVAAADAISASRPGGRRESLERYIKRLEHLEGLALEQHGVKQAYAIQAGREVRVLVDSAAVDDARAAKIAHDVAKRIEEEMTYPGEIRVTVIREIRAVGIAQ